MWNYLCTTCICIPGGITLFWGEPYGTWHYNFMRLHTPPNQQNRNWHLGPR